MSACAVPEKRVYVFRAVRTGKKDNRRVGIIFVGIRYLLSIVAHGYFSATVFRHV